MSIIVATTCASHKMDGFELSWLEHIERFRAQARLRGHAVDAFAALEVDSRGLAPFARLLGLIRLELRGGDLEIRR